MGLPHFTNISNVGSPGGPGTLPDEVVYLNLFEITFILPVLLQAQGRDPILLLENATKVNLGSANLTAFDVGQAQQRYKYSTREFLTTPTKTSGEITIPFQVPARVAPTGITATAANYQARNASGSGITLTAIAFNNASPTACAVLGTVASGLVQGNGTSMQLNGTILFTGCEL